MEIKLFVDGGNIGKNPSIGVYWSVGREHDDGSIELLTEREENYSFTTNNQAEWLALIDALAHVANLNLPAGQDHTVTIHSDSQLIVNQFNGKWTINDPQLRELCTTARAGAEFLSNGRIEVVVKWVRREENVKRLGH